MTIGHEMSGVVSAVGPGVDDLEVGDHVVVEPYIISDDVDTGPESLDYHLSPNMNFIGLGGRGGGLSEKIVVQRRWVHRISKDVPLDQAALVEPLAVGYHALQRSGAAPDRFALITGAGPIGLLTAAVCKARGLTVAISEPSSLRRNRARGDRGGRPRLRSHAGRRGGGGARAHRRPRRRRGLRVHLRAGPRWTPCSTRCGRRRCWWWCRSGGHPGTVDMQKLVLKEIDMRGTIAYVNNHAETIALVESGTVRSRAVHHREDRPDELVTVGYDTLLHHNETAVKILVSPSGAGLPAGV